MRTELKLYDIYRIFTFVYSLAKRFFTDKRKDAYSTETVTTYTASLTFLYSLEDMILYGYA